MTICQDLNAVSENVRIELARARRSARSIQLTLGISRTRWDRRMTQPDGWSLGELCLIARELNIPVARLLQDTE